MREDDARPLSDEAAGLVASERESPGIPDSVRAEVFAQLGATLGLGASARPASEGPRPTLWTSGEPFRGAAARGLRLRLVWLVGAAFVAGGAITAGLQVSRRHRTDAPGTIVSSALPRPSPAMPPAPAPMPIASPGPRPLPVPAPAPSPARRAFRATTAAGLDGDLDLAAEQKILDEARHALADGRVSSASVALRRHEDRFPEGRLVEERESLWIEALVKEGDFAGARERGHAFEERYPRSIFLPVVEEALRSLP